MNIFVGNLSANLGDDDLRQAFEPFGQVATAAVMKNRLNGESKGFGFVEMPDPCEAQAAIASLDGRDIDGYRVDVSAAHARSSSTVSRA
jgi:RNA recognition motif-containing protein